VPVLPLYRRLAPSRLLLAYTDMYGRFAPVQRTVRFHCAPRSSTAPVRWVVSPKSTSSLVTAGEYPLRICRGLLDLGQFYCSTGSSCSCHCRRTPGTLTPTTCFYVSLRITRSPRPDRDPVLHGVCSASSLCFVTRYDSLYFLSA
jgi:hypothetical protein